MQMYVVYIHFQRLDIHSVFSGGPPQYLRAKLPFMRKRQHPLAILCRPDKMILTFKNGVTASVKCHALLYYDAGHIA